MRTLIGFIEVWTANTKALTYTPNTNFQMGSVRFKLVTI